MRTNHLASCVGVAAVLILAGCGGGGDNNSSSDEAAEVTICRAALGRLGGVAPASLDTLMVSRSLYTTDYGKLVDFSNGEAIGDARYASYGSCQLAGATVLRVTLADGSVIVGP